MSDAFPQQDSYLDDMIRSANGLALSQFRSGERQRAIETLRQCLAKARRIPITGHESPAIQSEFASLLTNQGNFLREESGDLVRAEQSFEEAIQILQQLLVHQPESATFRRSLSLNMGNIAMIKLSTGDLEGTKQSLEAALFEAEAACARSPTDARILSNAEWQFNRLCETLLRMGDMPAVLNLAEQFAAHFPTSADRRVAASKGLAALVRFTPMPTSAEPSPRSNDVPLSHPGLTPSEKERLIAEAIRHLQLAVSMGYSRLSDLSRSEPFTFLAEDPRYRAMLVP